MTIESEFEIVDNEMQQQFDDELGEYACQLYSDLVLTMDKMPAGDAAREILAQMEEEMPGYRTVIKFALEDQMALDLDEFDIDLDVVCTCGSQKDNVHTMDCRLYECDEWVAVKWDWDAQDQYLYQRAPSKGGDYTSGGSQGTLWTPKCRHLFQPVTLDNGLVVHCSSHSGYGAKREAHQHPRFGLYAYSGWNEDWITAFIPWTDYGRPRCAFEHAAEEILRHYNLAVEGHAVELGCMGGHGRTGTMLAAMAVMAGTPANEAVAWVKTHYCKEAVEGGAQEWWVEWFGSWFHGTEPPAEYVPPPPPPKKEEEKKDKKKDKHKGVLGGSESLFADMRKAIKGP